MENKKHTQEIEKLIEYAKQQAINTTCYFFPTHKNEMLLLKEICKPLSEAMAIDIVAYKYNPSSPKLYQPIGNISAEIVNNASDNNLPFLFLSILTVNQEYRGCGLGHALLTLTQKKAIDKGCISIKSIFQPHSFLAPNNEQNISYLKKFYDNHGIHLRIFRKEELVGKELHGSFRSPTIRELYHKTTRELFNSQLGEHIKIYNPFQQEIPPELQAIEKKSTYTFLKLNNYTPNKQTENATETERSR